MPLVQPPGRAALENVEADRHALGVRTGQQGAQDGRADALPLELLVDEEALQAVPVLVGAEGDAAA